MKKMILPFATLFVGFLIGYFTYYFLLKHDINIVIKNGFTKNSNQNISNDIVQLAKEIYDETGYEFTGGSHAIDPKTANILINDFQRENESNTHIFPLKGSNQKRLRGFFIDKKPLSDILADSTNIGVSIYLAKELTAYNQGRTNRTYTFIYMGAKKKNAIASSPTNDNTIKYSNSTAPGTMYDFIDPCPDACGDFTQLMRQRNDQIKPKNK